MDPEPLDWAGPDQHFRDGAAADAEAAECIDDAGEDRLTGSSDLEANSSTGHQAKRPKPPPLHPLWLLASVQAADDGLVHEALGMTQLRSHALTDPSTASFKDAARFVSYLAAETGGLTLAGGTRRGLAAALPSAPLIHIAVRTMTDRPGVRTRLERVFHRLHTVHGNDGSGPSASSGGIRLSAFRKFFVEAMRVVSHDTLPTDIAERVAACEWRAARSHSSVAGTKALKAVRDARAAGISVSDALAKRIPSNSHARDSSSPAASLSAGPSSAIGNPQPPGAGDSAKVAGPTIPFVAFMEKALNFLVLFITHGSAFAVPQEANVVRLLSYISVCVLQLDLSDSEPAARPNPNSRQNTAEHAGDESAQRDGDVWAAKPPSRPATHGFLPPSRPLTYGKPPTSAAANTRPRDDNTGSDSPRGAMTAPTQRLIAPRPTAFGSLVPQLPVLLARRQQDEHVAPADLADATVAIGVTRLNTGLGESAHRVTTSPRSKDAAAYRKALKSLELYPHRPAAAYALQTTTPRSDTSPRASDEPATTLESRNGTVVVASVSEPVSHARQAGSHAMPASQQFRNRQQTQRKSQWANGAMGRHSRKSATRDGPTSTGGDSGTKPGQSEPVDARVDDFVAHESIPGSAAAKKRDPEVLKYVSIEGLQLV